MRQLLHHLRTRAAAPEEEDHRGRHGSEEQARAPELAARDQGKRGVLIQVRIHAHRHSGVLHAKEEQERGAPEHTARRGRCQRPRVQETGHRPRLQPQQRWRGQPRQGDRNVQLQEDDRALAPGRLPQHYRRLFLQRLRDMERDPPWLDAGQAEQAEGVPTGAGKGSCDSVHRTKGAPPHTEASAAVVRAVKATTAAALRPLYPGGARPKHPASIALAAAASPLGASKKKRCQMCPRKKDFKTHTVCRGCNKYICKGCSLVYCNMCAS